MKVVFLSIVFFLLTGCERAPERFIASETHLCPELKARERIFFDDFRETFRDANYTLFSNGSPVLQHSGLTLGGSSKVVLFPKGVEDARGVRIRFVLGDLRNAVSFLFLPEADPPFPIQLKFILAAEYSPFLSVWLIQGKERKELKRVPIPEIANTPYLFTVFKENDSFNVSLHLVRDGQRFCVAGFPISLKPAFPFRWIALFLEEPARQSLLSLQSLEMF